MRSFALMLGVLTFAAGAQAQKPAPAPTPKPSPDNYSYRFSRDDDNGDRAALGISTTSTGKRDTLGLMVSNVTVDSPADKAGIIEGDRIASVNGTSLKVNPADAGEPEMGGIMTRRLIRTLSGIKAGDEVSLVLYSNGGTKTAKVKTVAMDDLGGTRKKSSDRAAVGLNFGGSSIRDTLGLFIESVVKDGPADKAGIEEGDRVASINGVDMRIDAADAGDGSLSWAKQSRFTRVLMGVKPGDVVELKVWSDGKWKTVKVTTVKAADIYGKLGQQWREYGQALSEMAAPMARMAMPPMPPMPAMAPMPPMRMSFGDDEGMGMGSSRMTCETEGDGSVRCVNSPRSRSRNKVTVVTPDGAVLHERDMAAAKRSSGSMSYSHSSDDGDAEINFPGLRLTSVTPELASYFGAGSEKGLLVVEASDEWAPLKTGDVVLTLNGRAVVRGQTSSMALETDEDNKFSVIRKGKTVTLTVKAH